LRQVGDNVQLIPGENHWETYGYHVFKNDERITDSPIRPSESLNLPGQGTYTAVAVEWSGLESKPSFPLQVRGPASVTVLSDKPNDFSWIREQGVVEGDRAIVETVHLYDGVIHRSWYRAGEIVKRHDLNAEGKATRRLFYRDGKLARRQYHNRNGYHVSTEHLDADGYITESIQHGSRPRHWWYQKGVPTKYARGSDTYSKDGERWIKTKSTTEPRLWD